MIRKSNKVDYMIEKSYPIISLLNCLGKECEKLVAEMLTNWCEVHHILYERQTVSQRQQSVIDTVA